MYQDMIFRAQNLDQHFRIIEQRVDDGVLAKGEESILAETGLSTRALWRARGGDEGIRTLSLTDAEKVRKSLNISVEAFYNNEIYL